MLRKLFFIFGCIWLNKIVTFRSSHQRCSTTSLLKKRLAQVEAAARGVLCKKVFLEIWQNSQENTCARVSLLIKLACNFIKKETLAQVFSCEFCEISKNTFFTEHLRATASVRFKKMLTLHSAEVSSSPNSPLIFVTVFCGETNRSSLSQMKFLPAALLKSDSNTGVFLGNLRNF